MKVRLTKDFGFESAHRLSRARKGHHCRELHGHSFNVEISVEGEVDQKNGWIYDHARISEAVEPVLQRLDHHYLNEIPGLENPTIENIALWLWQRLSPSLSGLVEVVICETSKVRASYRGE